MKSLYTIVGAIIILAASAGELSAQSSSAASQVVTFGVRRTASTVVSDAQVGLLAAAEPGASNVGALKVTVGSESAFQQSSEFGPIVSDRSASKSERGSLAGAHENASLLKFRSNTPRNAGPSVAQANMSKGVVITLTE